VFDVTVVHVVLVSVVSVVHVTSIRRRHVMIKKKGSSWWFLCVVLGFWVLTFGKIEG